MKMIAVSMIIVVSYNENFIKNAMDNKKKLMVNLSDYYQQGTSD